MGARFVERGVPLGAEGGEVAGEYVQGEVEEPGAVEFAGSGEFEQRGGPFVLVADVLVEGGEAAVAVAFDREQFPDLGEGFAFGPEPFGEWFPAEASGPAEPAGVVLRCPDGFEVAVEDHAADGFPGGVVADHA